MKAWAGRTLIVRKLKGLEDIICENQSSLILPTIIQIRCMYVLAATIVSPRMDEHGWPFASVDPFPGTEVDSLYGADHIKDIYFKAQPDYKDR